MFGAYIVANRIRPVKKQSTVVARKAVWAAESKL